MDEINSTESEGVERNTFLWGMIGASLGVTALLSGGMVIRSVLPPGRSIEGKTKVGALAVANLSDLETDQPLFAEYGDDAVFVVKRSDDTVLAMNASCPHVGCKLSWEEDVQEFECPCHISGFDIEGALLYGPAGSDMIVATTEVDDEGNVIVSGFEV